MLLFDRIRYLDTIMRKITNSILVGAIAITQVGCVGSFINDIEKLALPDTEFSLAIPIANGEFVLADYIDQNSDFVSVEIDQDGLVRLVFNKFDQFEQRASDIIDIPDQQFSNTFGFSSGLAAQLALNNPIISTQNYSFGFDVEEVGDLLDSVTIKSGTFEIDLSGDFPASGNMSITIPSLVIGGSPYSETVSWEYATSGPSQSFTLSPNINGATLDLTQPGGNNDFEVDIQMEVIYEGQPISATNIMSFTLDIYDIEFNGIFGSFDTRTVDAASDTIRVDFFQDLDVQDVFIEEPSMTLTFWNSFGILVEGVVNRIAAREPGGQAVALSGSVVASPLALGAPSINEIGQTIRTDVVIDNTNSNVTDMIAILPSRIVYAVAGTINPSGLNSPQFVLDSSAIIVNYSAQIPLYGRFNKLTKEQEIEFDGGSLQDMIEASMILDIENGFPLGVDLQVYFEQNGRVLDSLFVSGENLIPAAEVDNLGIVTAPGGSNIEIELNDSKIDVIIPATHIRIASVLSTTNAGSTSVKFFETDKFKINISVFAKIDPSTL